MKKTRSGATIKTANRKDLIFYIIGVTPLVLQFLLCYVYINGEMFISAFREYTFIGDTFKYTYAGLKNFKAVISLFVDNDYMRTAFMRGFILYGLGLLRFPFEILVAYYVARRFPFGKSFHILLFLPGLLSSIVSALNYKYFLCECLPEIIRLISGKEVLSFLDTSDYMLTFGVIWARGFFCGVTGSVLLIGGTMNSIPESVSEAASLDGASETRQFISIYVPLIFPTITMFIIFGLAGVFLTDIGLYPYFGEYAPREIWTTGYYLTMRTQTADVYRDYPFLSAYGWTFTFLTAPVVFGGRWLLNKINAKFD